MGHLPPTRHRGGLKHHDPLRVYSSLCWLRLSAWLPGHLTYCHECMQPCNGSPRLRRCSTISAIMNSGEVCWQLGKRIQPSVETPRPCIPYEYDTEKYWTSGLRRCSMLPPGILPTFFTSRVPKWHPVGQKPCAAVLPLPVVATIRTANNSTSSNTNTTHPL